MTEQIDLDALEALARKATPGPWIADPPSAWDTDDCGGYQMQSAVRVQGAGSITWDDHGGEVFKPEDAEFIAAANPSVILALIAELRQARDTLEAVTAELRRSKDHAITWIFRAQDLGERVVDMEGEIADAFSEIRSNNLEWDETLTLLQEVTAERDELRKVVEEALCHDPLHGRPEGLHCGGMSPCIRAILSHALNPAPVPELFPGVAGALDDLTIWKDKTDD